MKKPKWLFLYLGLIMTVLLGVFLYLVFGSSKPTDFLETKTAEKKFFQTDPQAQSEFTSIVKKSSPVLRSDFEKYYDRLGPETILSILDQKPYCHSESHLLGQIIYEKKSDLSSSMNICQNYCTGGCFHGVLLGFFDESAQTDGHIDFNKLKDQIGTVCERQEFSEYVVKGGCIHGVGHAIAKLLNYDLRPAIDLCQHFPTPAEQYYCATGVYMERALNQGSQDDLISEFFPCDRYPYPAACFRYNISRKYKMEQFKELAKVCNSFDTPKVRRGCFHGLGFISYRLVVENTVNLNEICQFGDQSDQKMCIEGLMGVFSAYNTKQAAAVCTRSTLPEKVLCEKAVKVGNFGLDREMTFYEY